jgi:hypothetical protein
MRADQARGLLELFGLEVNLDADSGFVVVSKNWTVTAQDPSANTLAGSDITVTLKVTKTEDEQAPATPVEATSAGLELAHAISACDQYGDNTFIYGFNGDWLIDRRAAEIQDDQWYLKAGANITNEFGAEARYTVECYVRGSNDNPSVVDFLYY